MQKKKLIPLKIQVWTLEKEVSKNGKYLRLHSIWIVEPLLFCLQCV